MHRFEALQRTVKLSNGRSMPMIGVGTWKLQNGQAGPVLEKAIQMGCRHVDCSPIYGNEKDVGQTLSKVLNNYDQFKVKREDMFITSKLWNTRHAYFDALEGCELTLKDLQLDYLDLYIIHWPFSFESDENGEERFDENGVGIIKPVEIQETWSALEELIIKGKVRSIGVSNFSIKHLEELLAVAKIKPTVNQVELHPYLPQPQLLEYCNANGISLVAYSPLGSGEHPSLLEDPTVVEVANSTKMTPAQVLLSWGLTRETAIIPRTSNPKRLEENFDLRLLDEKYMQKFNDEIKTNFRFCNPVDWWKRDCFNDED